MVYRYAEVHKYRPPLPVNENPNSASTTTSYTVTSAQGRPRPLTDPRLFDHRVPRYNTTEDVHSLTPQLTLDLVSLILASLTTTFT